MDERRKRAYRYLLYYAMLDIRPIVGMRRSSFNPFQWKSVSEYVDRAGVIADWLHNLALFSAIGFDHFNEDWFWRELESRERQHPDFGLGHYRNVFDRELDREERRQDN